ncbi:hypothetical protein L3V66_12530, partial [Secundilactobacillus sp. HBUAS58055]|nr:hypothetical protein [Secundilactobacillus angelensis]
VGYYDTAVNLIAMCLDLDSDFRTAYETYQAILSAVKERDVTALERTLNNYYALNNRMDQSIKSLKKYQVSRAVIKCRFRAVKNVGF